MKINLPITNVEHALSENDSIVTKTDLKGIITYAGDDFIEISGFTREELIGSSHNIIRHPDMPPEVFKDLWGAMKAGRPWTGIVKNRCKNGDFYWVLADITPYYENDRLAGYMSVRRKPTSEQVEHAASNYKKLREGAKNLIVKNGQVIRKKRFAIWPSIEHLSIKARLLTVITLMSVLLLAIGWMGVAGMSKDTESMRVVHTHHMLTSNQIFEVQKLLLANQLKITAALLNPSPESIPASLDNVSRNIAAITRIWDDYANSSMSPVEKKLVDQVTKDRNRFEAEGIQPALAALRNDNMLLATKIIGEKIIPSYVPLSEGIQALLKIQVDDTRQALESSQVRYFNTREVVGTLVGIGILLALWLSFSLLRSIVRPLNATIDHFNQISQGKYLNLIEIDRMDEVGKVLAALKAMQIKLGFDIEEARRIADENLRIKIALDNVSTGVMIADNDRNIIYANKSVLKMFSKAEADIRREIPDFSCAALVGSNIDRFHKQPEKKAELLATATACLEPISINWGDRCYMVVTACPVTNSVGKCMGYVAEWVDRTAEVMVEKEVAVILVAAVMGDFTKRIAMQGKTGFFRELSESINQLMQTSESGLNETVRVFNALSHGDLTEKIQNHYDGTFGQLKEDANSTVDELNSALGKIRLVSESIHAAAKDIAHGNSSLSHRTEVQASSLDQTTVSMQKLTSTVQQNTENAKHARELAVSASSTAGKGVIVIDQVVKMMEGINDSSRKVVEIIAVIDSIAFQTNILALNAAVEAARAGEQGRGFAVVAGEVRNLAQRAASAAGEIKNLIGDSVEKVEDGSKLVLQAGKTMEDIVNSIRGVTAIMSDISAASVEQTSGIEQVNMAICQMDDVTQQNAALVGKASLAAASLEDQTQHLTVIVNHFKMEGSASNDAVVDSLGEEPESSHVPVGHIVKLDPQSADSGGWEEF